ncbi:DUF1642 domain-containing protein [Ligilactobacillus murinus]|uniref:DUF1642 domain-containing protein n=1 Tax=Ligilactobacillus murinus TaxID=1622 RepID=UPI0014418562|nr:DUF1642 domain-containing protein [Ligilactobacillus murinus]
MEEQKLVLKDSVVEINFETKQVIVPEEELRKAGYVKLADDEQVVKKVELVENWAKFMKENKHLPFSYKKDGKCFTDEVNKAFCEIVIGFRERQELFGLLIQAYFNGYTVKKEPRYYIEFPAWQTYEEGETYLNVDKIDGAWELGTKDQIGSAQCQFTQAEIDELQKDERARGTDFNVLKVRVPDDELED